MEREIGCRDRKQFTNGHEYTEEAFVLIFFLVFLLTHIHCTEYFVSEEYFHRRV